MIPLCVPISDYNEVSNLGARWQPNDKFWYIDGRFSLSNFERWLPKRYQSNQGRPALVIDPLPQNSPARRLKSIIGDNNWNDCKKIVFDHCGHRCRICGSGERMMLHPTWFYEHDKGVQKLVYLHGYCRNCRDVASGFMGRKNELGIHRLCEINGWQAEEAEDHIKKRLFRKGKLEEKEWELDLSIIEKLLSLRK